MPDMFNIIFALFALLFTARLLGRLIFGLNDDEKELFLIKNVVIKSFHKEIFQTFIWKKFCEFFFCTI